MKKDELYTLIEQCKDIATEKEIGEDLIYINIENKINFVLKIDENHHPYYEINANDLINDSIKLEDVYKLLLHGWILKEDKLILYI